jgi:hypothetical protein
MISDSAQKRRTDRRYIMLMAFVFAMIATFSFIFTHNMAETSAADLSLFKPGNIMSDEVMSDYNSMTEEEIQIFLKSKNKCNDTGIERAALYPTVTYHIENGHFVCMADELFDNNETGKKETAAHIIWQASQDYHVNPQVLIVLLQKEQGLVTDTWPNNIQYRSATGYGCPDTSACNTKYYGFRNQVRNAAKLFHTVLTGGWTNYPLGNNYIQYNPSKSCGGSVVYVENLATSSLYRYTPYQPNAGALKAYTGTAPCGAYGNRNFFIYFSDWFGDPTKVTPAAEPESTPEPEQPAQTEPEQPVEQTPSESQQQTPAESTEEPETPAPTLSAEATAVYNALDKKKIKDLGEVKDEVIKLKDEKGAEQTALIFENGLAYVAGNETKILNGKIYLSWLSSRAQLGNIKTVSVAKSGVNILECESGVLAGKDDKGYKYVDNTIHKKYNSQVATLGYPVNVRSKNAKTGIEWQQFEKGYIVGNDSKGWFISIGKSREVWAKYNYEAGLLGFPTSDIKENAGTGIKWQNYENGVIVGNDKKGWFISYGRSRNVWAKYNYEAGLLGFPTSDIKENTRTGMKWQEYEHGYIVGNDSKGWYISYGKIREKWAKAGYETGRFGWPRSDVIDGKYQRYTGGTIYK